MVKPRGEFSVRLQGLNPSSDEIAEPAMKAHMTLPDGHLIRPLRQADLPAVHEIECSCQAQPWTVAHFEAERDHPCSSIDVYQWGDAVAGFLCSWLIADELQIQNLATAQDFRRKGVAWHLLEHVLDRTLCSGMEAAWLEVRASNLPAIALYREHGFQDESRRPNYYHDGEDALIMAFHRNRR